MTLGEKIRFYRKRADITQAELGKLLGVQDSAVSKWEKGRVDNLTISQIQTMAEVFQVSPMDLAGWGRESDRADAGDRALRVAKLYGLASAHEREIIDLMLKPYESKLGEIVPDSKTVPFPAKKRPRRDGFEDLDVYDQPSAAGLGNYLDVPVSQREQYPAGIIPTGTSFGIVISGDSMQPRIANGATAFVQAAPALDHGEVGIFVLNGQSYCKQLVIDRERREVRLHSVNPRYDDIPVLDSDELRTIGRVLGSYPQS